MGQRFIASDHHLGHDNVWAKFTRLDGRPLRPFSSTEEMNETIIQNHNSVVKKADDIVVYLGDITINKKFMPLVKRMNGRKIIIMGNHDKHALQLYIDAGFEAILGSKEYDGFIVSHIPLHTSSVNRFGACVHGHFHDKFINDPRYLCVCMEHTCFTPLAFEEIYQRLKDNQDHFAATGKVIDYSDLYYGRKSR